MFLLKLESIVSFLIVFHAIIVECEQKKKDKIVEKNGKLEDALKEYEDCKNDIKSKEEIIDGKNEEIIKLQTHIEGSKEELENIQNNIVNSLKAEVTEVKDHATQTESLLTTCQTELSSLGVKCSEDVSDKENLIIENAKKVEELKETIKTSEEKHAAMTEEILSEERAAAAVQCEESFEQRSKDLTAKCIAESAENIELLKSELQSTLESEKTALENSCADQIGQIRSSAQVACDKHLDDVEKEATNSCNEQLETFKTEADEKCKSTVEAETQSYVTECDSKIAKIQEDSVVSCSEEVAKEKDLIKNECDVTIQSTISSANQQTESYKIEIQSNFDTMIEEKEKQLDGECQAKLTTLADDNEGTCNAKISEKVTDLTNNCAEKLKLDKETSENLIKRSQESIHTCEISLNECKDQLKQSQLQSETLKNMLETKDKESQQKDVEQKTFLDDLAAEKEELLLYLIGAGGTAAVLFLYIIISCIVSRCCGSSGPEVDNYLTLEELTTSLKTNGTPKQNGSSKKSKKEKQSKKNK